MDKRKIFCVGLVVLVGLATGSCSRSPSDEAAISAAAESIRPEALKAHTEFLADDALEGRGTGTRGHDLAVKYLRAQFAALGLKR